MGNDCFASTPNQFYNSYLCNINVSELKDLWQTTKIYKMKKIYQSFSKQYPDDAKKTFIPFQTFVQMFPQFNRYQEIHKKRLFEIFDFGNLGFLDWNNFFTTISICYFASQEILSVLIFMIFDQALCKQLNKQQVQILVQLNSFTIKNTNQNCSNQQINQIADLMLGGKVSIQIDEWIQISKRHFDFSKYRRLFNVFKEQKMEKQLVLNYDQWNQLYSQLSDKYISYVVCYKWFEAWKLYVEQNYRVSLNVYSSKQATNKSMKTKNNIGKKVIDTMGRIVCQDNLKFPEDVEGKGQNQPEQPRFPPKNIDMIHSNIGQRPRQIYNSVLQGQFKQVLKTQLVQNRDYVLVSQKIWSSLKQIYGGGPQFRRTGFDSVQLYPKVVKIYSFLFKDHIDYSSEVVRQVSGYLTVEQLLTRSIGLNHSDLKRKKIYYKTIGMLKWEELNELYYMFSELTNDVVVFLVYLQGQQEETFRKYHGKIAKDISQINAGDYLKYTDPQTTVEKQAIFMGKNIEGKYILHFPKQSYSLDKCFVQSDMIKYCQIYTSKNLVNELKLKNKSQNQIKGIQNSKGLGFVNSILLNLFNNKNFKSMISMMSSNDDNSKMLYFLIDIYKALSQKKKVDTRDIYDVLELFLPNYQNFEVSMSENFLRDFYTQLVQELNEIYTQKNIEQSFKVHIKSVKKCLKCDTQYNDEYQDYCINIPLTKQKQLLYEIVFVPICTSLKSTEIKKYGITLPIGATLKDLKFQFEAICKLDKKRPYALAQVYCNRIIRNYNSVQQNIALSKLKLRNGDSLYAFELYVDFNKFINSHYSQIKNMAPKDLKVDSFVDCKHSQKGWIFGKISQVQLVPYTQQTLVKVIHKFSKDEQWQIKYNFSEDTISKFPSKCYMNAEQYHVQALQRYFNQSANQMQVCNMPLVMVLTSWMRWKEFIFLVYLQLKRFISAAHGFQEPDGDDQEQIQNLKLITNKDFKSVRKIVNSLKKNKFEQYLNGKKFPYDVHLVDAQGRCAICFKFSKSKIFKGESQSYCQGCQLSLSQPIIWQVKITDVMVCIDWKSPSSYQKQIIKQDSSLINLKNDKKAVVQNLTECIKRRFQPSKQNQQLLCCNAPQKVSNREWIQNSPQVIPIFLSRIVEQDDGYKMINTNFISYPMKGLTLGKDVYGLIGITSIEGNSRNIKYKTYILKQNIGGVALGQGTNSNLQQWIEYDGEHTKVVSQNVAQRACPLVLYYKKQK